MKGLGVRFEGQAAMRWQQFQRRGIYNLEYGSMARKVATVAAPLAFAAAPGGLPGVSALARRDKKHEAEARR